MTSTAVAFGDAGGPGYGDALRTMDQPGFRTLAAPVPWARNRPR
ncbi:hypothetical protein [Streptomyces uncialis]|nr:hypothetical protein OG924_23340 [Streptomyces uncialis]